MAYSVSNEYRDVIYSGDAQHTAILTINDIEILDEQISKIELYTPMFDNEASVFTLGQFASNQTTIYFKNMDNIPIEGEVNLSIGTLVNDDYEYVPTSTKIIEYNQDDYYKNNKLVCLDSSITTLPNIDISSFVPCTIEELLHKLGEYYNIEIGTYPNVNRDYKVSTYDSTLSGKFYFSMIAELMGGNIKIGRDNKLNIIPLKKEYSVEIDATEGKTWKYESTYKVSRVTYDNGTVYCTYGDDTGNTLYIRKENIFVLDDYEELIENIYNAVVGAEISSVETENYGDPSLDAEDVIKYILDDEVYYTYNNNTITYEMNIMSKLKTSIPNKVQESTTNVIGNSDAVKIRKMQSTINQEKLRVDELYQEQDGTNKKITEIERGLDGVKISIDEMGEKVKDIVVSKGISGNPVIIEDAGPYEIQSLEIEGKSKASNNLIDFSNPTWKSASNTYTFQNDILSFTGNTASTWTTVKWNITKLVKNNPDKVLSFYLKSFDVSNTYSPIIQLEITPNGGSKSWYTLYWFANSSKQAYKIPTNTSNINLVELCIVSNNTGTSIINGLTITKPMVYFGASTNPPEYEPYYEFRSVVGITNLFNEDTVEKGRIALAGTVYTGSEDEDKYRVSSYIKVNPSTTYNVNMLYIDDYHRIGYYDVNKTFISGNESNTLFTTPSNCEYVRLTLATDMVEQTIMVEGNQGKDYVPYGTWLKQKSTSYNLCNNNWESGSYDGNGIKYTSLSRIRLPMLVQVKNIDELYFDTFNSTYLFTIRVYDDNGTFIKNIGTVSNKTTIDTSEVSYIAVSIVNSSNDIGSQYQTIIDKINDGEIKPFICDNSITSKEYQPYQENVEYINFEDIELGEGDIFKDGTITKSSGTEIEVQNYEPLELFEGYNYITLNSELFPTMNIRYLTDSSLNATYEQKGTIEATKEQILLSVSEDLEPINKSIEDLQGGITSLDSRTTSISTEVGEVKVNFETTTKEIQEVNGQIQEEQSKLNAWITMREEDNIPSIELGTDASNNKLKLDNDSISIINSNNTLSKWYQDAFEVSKLYLGDFAFIPRANGNLSFRKIRK